MAITKGKIISDIELRLSKGKPSDDLSIIRPQLEYWLDTERDSLVSDILTESIKNKDVIDPYYIVNDLCLTPTRLDDNCVDCRDKYRFYIDLTREILFLPGDRGVVRITDNDGRSVSLTTENELEVFKDLMFSGPSKKNQMAYREGSNRLFIEKLDDISLQCFQYDVYYIAKAVGAGIGLDEDYPISDEDLPELTDRVFMLGLKQMSAGVSDLENDGTDPSHYE